MLPRSLRLAAVCLFLSLTPLAAEEPRNGPRHVDPGWHALVGATVHDAWGDEARVANVVIRDGKILSVGDEAPPAGARVWDLAGHHVYPAFIDACVMVDAPRPPKGSASAHWNPLVTPTRSPLEGAGIPEETKRKLRELGFGAAQIVPKDGVLRGTSALVSLRKRDPAPGAPKPPVYARDRYDVIAFDRARGENGGFPDSLMGSIALIRQCLIDDLLPERRWEDEMDLIQCAGRYPLLFVVEDELSLIRAQKVAAEFGRPAVVIGSGTEFRRLDAIRSTRAVIVPLNFPKKPKIRSIGDAEAVSLRELMTWEQAPTNPRRLMNSDCGVALTTHGLKDVSKFRDRVRTAIRHGLTDAQALRALTYNASLLTRAEDLGGVKPGNIASLQVTDGPVFAKNTRLRWLFIDGVPEEMRAASLAGKWELTTTPAVPDAVTLAFDHHDGLNVESSGKKAEAVVDRDSDRIDFTFDHANFGDPGHFVLSGAIDGETMAGAGERADGKRFRWTARRVSRDVEKKEWEKEEPKPEVPEEIPTPFGAYGTRGLPPIRDLVITGATLWTSGPGGVIENGALVIKGGKIVYAGDAEGLARMRLTLPVVDAKGKHITPGIIDCHSHTGISGGINDSGQAVTAEVRIEDVTDPDNVNFYRQLAGGVTVLNALHGSANPIGGQSSTVKLRWGVSNPDDMHMAGAKPGIKFALGENVKQSNWGDKHTTRYPQTRMGVETLMRDRFVAAREYAAARKRDDKTPRDLELEALAEVLEGERLVHCHAYRQDEILMLCRLSEEFGFRVGTFQHVLEGYKVAEAIRARSLGGSCFSDWWAYKVEVQDAIPENGPIMREVGVIVSYNSDSADLARRLNTEAAKAMKYGGLSMEEALKLITINPAIQLGIEKRVGSFEVGKDADFVIWSGPPLSSLSRCEQTFIDGREYWSLAKDAGHREWIGKERRRLIQKVLAAKGEGEDGKKKKEEREYRCCDTDEGGAR